MAIVVTEDEVQQPGAGPKFGKAGGRKICLQIRATMSRFSERIFILLSFPVIFDIEFLFIFSLLCCLICSDPLWK